MCQKTQHAEESVTQRGNLSRSSKLITKFSGHESVNRKLL